MGKKDAPVLEDVSAIVLSRDLRCRPDVAWRALTDADRIAAWWGGHVFLEAKPDGIFREVWRDDDGRDVVTSGMVVGFAPPRQLRLTWMDDNWPAETLVTFDLAADADGATLTLIHDGWALFPAADGPRLRQAHAAGWRHHLDNLAALVNGESP